MTMSLNTSLVRPEIAALAAYHVPDASGLIKLDAMENPYGFPATLTAEWLQTLQDVAMNRYPDPSAKAVKQALITHELNGLPDGCELLLGNGSDEIIQMLMLAVAQPGAKVLAPTPGFVMYEMVAKWCGLEFVGVPLQQNFSLDLPAMLDIVQTQQPALIFLAYPNNPTGNLFAEDDLRAILEAAEGLVVIDEAYAPFSAKSTVSWLADYPNMLLMRTLSKFGLAGLRLGYLLGRSEWLHEFDKVRMPYNINVLTQATVAFAMQHRDVFLEQAAAICRDRTQVRQQLQGMGLQVFESEANFLLVKVPVKELAAKDVTSGSDEGLAKQWFEQLKSQGVLVKCLHGGHPLLQDCLRVTIGTPDENAKLINTLKTLLPSS